jgi:hypothetical protein
MASEEIRSADKTKPDYRQAQPINRVDSRIIYDSAKDNEVFSQLKSTQD